MQASESYPNPNHVTNNQFAGSIWKFNSLRRGERVIIWHLSRFRDGHPFKMDLLCDGHFDYD